MTDNDEHMTAEEWQHSGAPERRKEQRRKAHERRYMLRFELKDDRRSGNERRKDLQSGWDGGMTI